MFIRPAHSMMASPMLLKLRDPRSLHEQYQSAEPFPHIVLDGLFDDAASDRVLGEFPKPDETSWRPLRLAAGEEARLLPRDQHRPAARARLSRGDERLRDAALPGGADGHGRADPRSLFRRRRAASVGGAASSSMRRCIAACPAASATISRRPLHGDVLWTGGAGARKLRPGPRRGGSAACAWRRRTASTSWASR